MKSKRLTLFLSFLVPTLIVTGYFIYRGFAPFGSSSVMTVDMGQQYVDFFSYFRTTLLHDPSGFFYSFGKALGGDMLGTWSYYLMSPFNLLLLLFPLSKLPSVVAIITILKYAFAGLTSAILFIKTRPQTNGWITVGFATTYSLIGWMVANQLNILWVDGVILLPLIFLGLNQLLKGQSTKLYIISLAAVLMINYYIGWMIAIFVGAYTVIFTLCKAYETTQSYLKVFLKWLGASLVSGALAAWILIPTFKALASSKMGVQQLIFAFKFEYNPLNMIAKFVNGAFDFTQLPKGTPNIFVGSAVLILFLYSFFSPTINRRRKIANGLLTAFLVLSMSFQPLDVIWHGMAAPVWYPYRFSFVFSFLLIVIAFEALADILANGVVWWGFASSLGLMVLGFIYILIILKKLTFLTPLKLVITVIFLLITAGLLFAWQRYPQKRFFPLLLCVVMAAEMGTNFVTSLNGLSYLPNANYTEFSKLIRQASTKANKMDPNFHRIAETFNRTRNDPFTGNFNGGSVFSSTLETSTTQFFNNMGNPSDVYYAVYANGTTFTDSLLSMKYYFTARKVTGANETRKSLNYLVPLTSRPDLNNYPVKAQTDLINIHENPNALPLGFMTRAQYMFPINNMADPISYQTEIASQLDPTVKNIFTPIPITHVKYDNAYPLVNISNGVIRKRDKTEPASLDITVPVKKHHSYYVSLGPRMSQQAFTYQVNGKTLQQYRASAKDTLLNLSSVKGTDKTIHFKILANINRAPLQNVYLYSVDNTKVATFANHLKQNPYRITKYTNSEITGTIDSPRDNGTMVTTIPYSKGWHASVDGRTVTPKQWAHEFMAINLSKGHHVVKFTYFPLGLSLGLTISLTTLGLIILFLGFQIYKRRRSTTHTK